MDKESTVYFNGCDHQMAMVAKNCAERAVGLKRLGSTLVEKLVRVVMGMIPVGRGKLARG